MDTLLLILLIFILVVAAVYWRYLIAKKRLAICIQNKNVLDYNPMSISISASMKESQKLKILREKWIVDNAPWFFRVIERLSSVSNESK
jgi:cell division protein YceG involved in septum cleavage